MVAMFGVPGDMTDDALLQGEIVNKCRVAEDEMLWSMLLFPFIVRQCARIDRWRVMA